MTYNRRFGSSLLCSMLLAGALASPLSAGSIVHVIAEDRGADPDDRTDDAFINTPLFWGEDELPLRVTIQRSNVPQGFNGVLPGSLNFNSVSDDDVQQAVRRAISQWNGADGASFEFASSPGFSTDYPNPYGDSTFLPFGPSGVRPDGFNLVTFQEVAVVPADGVLSLPIVFYMSEDFDPDEDPRSPTIQIALMENVQIDGTAEDFIDIIQPLPTGFTAQIVFPRREYKAGEIVDADIVMSSLPISGSEQIPFGWSAFPEDSNGLGNLTPPLVLDDTIGAPDIQAAVSKGLGEMAGLGHSQLSRSTMWPFYGTYDAFSFPLPGDTNAFSPYETRTLEFDDLATLARAYPDGGSGTTIYGTVINGASYLTTQGGTTGITGTGADYGISDAIVFFARPHTGPQHGDTLEYRSTSPIPRGPGLAGELDSGNLELFAHTTTGGTRVLSSGINSDLGFASTDGTYWFPGLTGGPIYAILAAPEFPWDSLSAFSFDGQADIFSPEFFGGVRNPAPLPGAGIVDLGDARFDTIRNGFLRFRFEAEALDADNDGAFEESERFSGARFNARVIDGPNFLGALDAPDTTEFIEFSDQNLTAIRLVRQSDGRVFDFNNRGLDGFGYGGVRGVVVTSDENLDEFQVRFELLTPAGDPFGTITQTFRLRNYPVVAGNERRGFEIEYSYRNNTLTDTFDFSVAQLYDSFNGSAVNENTSNVPLYINDQLQEVATLFSGGGPSTIDWYDNPQLPFLQFSIFAYQAGTGLTTPSQVLTTNAAQARRPENSLWSVGPGGTLASDFGGVLSAADTGVIVRLPAQRVAPGETGTVRSGGIMLSNPKLLSETSRLFRTVEGPYGPTVGGPDVAGNLDNPVDGFELTMGPANLYNVNIISNASLTPGIEGDQDGDDVVDSIDNCPWVFNPEQDDENLNGIGDVCEGDRDGDGIGDGLDNCPEIPNFDQSDSDNDGLGDLCDTDRDNDGIDDNSDNCPFLANPDQADSDLDGVGDACEGDFDNDGVPDPIDNCLSTPNPSQADLDEDGVGDQCDADRDGDGVENQFDNCPDTPNASQADADGDGVGDACDGLARFILRERGPASQDSTRSQIPNIRLFVSSAASGDLNGDGYQDLVLGVNATPTNNQSAGLANRIWMNEGASRPGFFRDETFGIDQVANSPDDRLTPSQDVTQSVVLFDFDLDGDLDMFLGNWGSEPQLFLNVDVDDPTRNPNPDTDSLGDGFFVDASNRGLPGTLNFRNTPTEGAFTGRRYSRSKVADIDADGDLDIIVALIDSAGDAFYDPGPDPLVADDDFGLSSTETSDFQVFDGTDFSPEDEPPTIDDFEGLSANQSRASSWPPPEPLLHSELIWINRRDELFVRNPDDSISRMPRGTPDAFETFIATANTTDVDALFSSPSTVPGVANVNGFWFRDETLGHDTQFTGVVPPDPATLGGLPVTIDPNWDRLPPSLYDLLPLPDTASDQDFDLTETSEVAVGRFSELSLGADIRVANSDVGFPGPDQSSYDGYDPVFVNMDLDGDLVPDGYFVNLDFGTDIVWPRQPEDPTADRIVGRYRTYPEDPSETRFPTVDDIWPFLIGVPDGSGAGDLIEGPFDDDMPYDESLSLASVAVDLFNRGYADFLDATQNIEGDDSEDLLVTTTLIRAVGGVGSPGISRAIQTENRVYGGSSSGFAVLSVPLGISGASVGDFESDPPTPDIRQEWQFPTLDPDTAVYTFWADQEQIFPPLGRVRGIAAVDLDFNGGKDVITTSDADDGVEETDFGIGIAGNSSTGGFIRVSLNRDADGFTADSWVSAESFVLDRNQAIAGACVVPFDADNDNDYDLFVGVADDLPRFYVNSLYDNSPGLRPNLISAGDPPLFHDRTRDFIDDVHSVGVSDISGGATANSIKGFTTGSDVADVDRDGDPDLAIFAGALLTDLGDMSILLTNRGSERVAGTAVLSAANAAYPAGRVATPGFPRSTFETQDGRATSGRFFDFDNDGDLDLLIGNFAEPNALFENRDVRGANLFSSSPVLNPSNLAALGYDPAFFLNTLSAYDVRDMRDSAAWPAEQLAVEPLGDGVFDLSLEFSSGTGILRLPDTQFEAEGQFTRLLTNEIVVGDIDNDADLDVFYANGLRDSGAPNVLLRNTPTISDTTNPNSFASRLFEDVTNQLPIVNYVQSTGSGPEIDDTADGAFFDVDNDNDLDLLVVNRRAQVFVDPDSTTLDFKPAVRLLINQGGAQGGTIGFFVRSTTFPTITGFPEKVALADFSRRGDYAEDINGDGMVTDEEKLNFDNIVKATGSQALVRSRAVTGTYAQLVTDFSRDPNPNAPTLLTRRDPRYIDWNSDGEFRQVLDIFMATTSGTPIYLSNDGNGNFANTTTTTMPDLQVLPYTDVAVGDVDLDGLLDIVLATATGQENEASARLMVNRTTVDGVPAFATANNEIPHPDSTAFGTIYGTDGTLQGRITANDGNARAVSLLDVDNDGDLDLYVGELGRAGDLRSDSGLDAFYENRAIGAGFSSPLPPALRRVTGGTVVSPGLALSLVSPSSATPGDEIVVRVYGNGFKGGMTLNFGAGIQIVQPPIVRNSSTADVTIKIATTATLGSRTLTAVNQDGITALSPNGAFTVTNKPSSPTGAPPQDWLIFH